MPSQNWIMDMKARRQEFLDQMRLKEIENRQNFMGLDHEKMFADIKIKETKTVSSIMINILIIDNNSYYIYDVFNTI